MKLENFIVGNDQSIFLIAGTCVIESEQMTMDVAGTLVEITQHLGIPFIYKSSFDKANRSSNNSFRGPGLEAGLKILEKVKNEFTFCLTKELVEKLNLKDWFKAYKKEALVSTAGIRGPQNILYPHDTRFPINTIGITLATLAKALVLKEKYTDEIRREMT